MTKDNDQPTDSKKSSLFSGSFSFYTKLIGMMVLVFLASIGYFHSNLMDRDHFPDTGSVNTEDDLNTVGDDEESRLSAKENRKQIKDLVLTTSDNKTAHLSDFRGKVVILSFWASDCAPCLEELPTFAKLQKEIGSDKLAIIPINIEDDNSLDQNLISAIWKKNSLPFPTYYDSKQVNAEIMDIQIIPTNYILDKSGRIAFSSFGYNNWASTKAMGLVRALVDEKN